MKILVAYDESPYSESAIDDLKRAGLPPQGEAIIFSVAEVWLPPADAEDIHLTDDPYIHNVVSKRQEKSQQALAEVQDRAKTAEERLKNILPDWTVSSAATYGSPAWEIIAKADEVLPDLIVVGSQGLSGLSRFFLGSISQKVLTEASSSVRVARGKNDVDASPIRIAIGFDSSKGAEAAVNAVAARNWPAETEVKLIAVTDPVKPSTIGRLMPPLTDAVDDVNDSEQQWLTEIASPMIEKLSALGLTASLEFASGNPKSVLVEAAENWNADTIFVGANAFGSKIERFLIGSTSSAVAARAHCTVEVVRTT